MKVETCVEKPEEEDEEKTLEMHGDGKYLRKLFIFFPAFFRLSLG